MSRGRSLTVTRSGTIDKGDVLASQTTFSPDNTHRLHVFIRLIIANLTLKRCVNVINNVLLHVEHHTKPSVTFNLSFLAQSDKPNDAQTSSKKAFQLLRSRWVCLHLIPSCLSVDHPGGEPAMAPPLPTPALLPETMHDMLKHPEGSRNLARVGKTNRGRT